MCDITNKMRSCVRGIIAQDIWKLKKKKWRTGNDKKNETFLEQPTRKVSLPGGMGNFFIFYLQAVSLVRRTKINRTKKDHQNLLKLSSLIFTV